MVWGRGRGRRTGAEDRGRRGQGSIATGRAAQRRAAVAHPVPAMSTFSCCLTTKRKPAALRLEEVPPAAFFAHRMLLPFQQACMPHQYGLSSRAATEAVSRVLPSAPLTTSRGVHAGSAVLSVRGSMPHPASRSGTTMMAARTMLVRLRARSAIIDALEQHAALANLQSQLLTARPSSRSLTMCPQMRRPRASARFTTSYARIRLREGKTRI